MFRKITYITYASGKKYLDVADDIVNKSKNFFNDTILYGIGDIDENFYNKNKKIFESTIGAGYWLWKPYLILKALETIEENDIVFYLDLGDNLHQNISEYVRKKIDENNGFFLVSGHHHHLKWTKNDCFTLMNCFGEKYFNSIQLEAGCCAFQKKKEVLDFIKEWLFYCQNYDIISNESVSKNSPIFIEHRYDQSILTNLKIKYDIKTVSIHEIGNFITYNNYF